MNIELTRVKILPGNNLYVEGSKATTKDGEIIKIGDFKDTFDYIASDELIKAFDPLKLHWAILTEYLPQEKVSKDDFSDIDAIIKGHKVLENVTCNHINFSKGDVFLIGNRRTRFGTVCNTNGILRGYEDADNDYEFAYELNQAIREIEKEVVRYMHGHGKEVQLSLFADAVLLKEESA